MIAPAASVTARFWSYVRQTDDGCWDWTGQTADGYGRFRLNGRVIQAHRLAYELLIGPIPDGLVIDHLCRTRRCVNPEHMEPVTNAENLARGVSFSAVNRAKTHCPAGHPYDADNTYIGRSRYYRQCRECTRARQRRVYHQRKTAVAARGETRQP